MLHDHTRSTELRNGIHSIDCKFYEFTNDDVAGKKDIGDQNAANADRRRAIVYRTDESNDPMSETFGADSANRNNVGRRSNHIFGVQCVKWIG